jgi:hypothetical protein
MRVPAASHAGKMKLRIKGNSIRLRLTQGEVVQLASDGRVENAASFGSGDLRYAVSAVPGVGQVTADFLDNTITILVPANMVAEWARSETVGIESSQSAGNGELHILIEKDFACLKPRVGDDDTDSFANPLAAGNG